MILLDTNVVSESLRPRPDPAVVSWFARQDRVLLYLSTVTVAELNQGIAFLPDGRRRQLLSATVADIVHQDFADRVVPFDLAAADLYGSIVAERRGQGRPIQPLDAQIAAIAVSRRAALATRNTPDFEGCGLALINPWDSRKDDA